MGLRHGQGRNHGASLEHCTHRDRTASHKGQHFLFREYLQPGMHHPRGWEGAGGTAGGALAGESWICSGEDMGWDGKLSWGQAVPGLRPADGAAPLPEQQQEWGGKGLFPLCWL